METHMRSAILSLVLLVSAACVDGAGGVDAGPDARPDAGAGPGDAGPDVSPDAGPDAGEAPASSCASDVTAADLDDGAWDERFTISGFTGHDGIAPAVYDFATDVDGSLIATGRFQWIGSTRTAPLARWRDGAWVPARDTWEQLPTDDGFAAIAIASNGEMALATNDSFGERSGEIWLDDGSGLVTIGAFEGQMRSLAWYGGALWAAGYFVMDDGAMEDDATDDDAIQGLAVWDGTGWSSPPGGGVDGFAFELLRDGDELLVGGLFQSIGGIEAAGVAGYDGTTWRALDLPGAMVYALARGEDGALYAGGALGALAPGAGGLARWDGAAWQLVGGGLAMYAWPGVVTDIVAHDGSLHVTGCFATAGGPEGGADTIAVGGLARFDGTRWHAAGDPAAPVTAPWFQPAVCGDEGPTAIWDVAFQRLAQSDDRVFLGGTFAGVGGVASQSIIGYENGALVPQGQADLGVNGAFEALAAGGDGCTLYALGDVSHASGTPVSSRVLRFTGEGWQPLADDIPAAAWCPALAVSPEGDVVLGCLDFDEATGPVGLLYRGAGDVLERVDVELPPVHGLAFDDDGRLWIVGGAETGYLARLDADDALTVIEDRFDGVVSRVAARGDDVVVGGDFLHVGDLPATRVARWDTSAWSALGDGVPGSVVALARDRDTVYVSTYEGPEGMYLLGAFDGQAWRELASAEAGITPQPQFTFHALATVDGAVIAAGTAVLDSGEGRGAFVYEDGRFRPLGGGVRAMFVSGLAVTPDAVWFGGGIAEAGTGEKLRPTAGVARYVLRR